MDTNKNNQTNDNLFTEKENKINITFSTCFYVIKSKFDVETYMIWISNFLSIVNNFYLVIYTDNESLMCIKNVDKNNNILNNPNIKIIIKPITDFYNYKYKKEFIKNHVNMANSNNIFLKRHSQMTSWQLNMVWCEKIWFVNNTIKNNIFNTDFYGWCDIGYFRNRQKDVHTNNLKKWPNDDIICNLNRDKIYYAIVNNNKPYMEYLKEIIINMNDNIITQHIPYYQSSVAGGFFILHKEKINWWCNTFENKLNKYFLNQNILKDDQIIIIDCIFSDISHFELIYENNYNYDNWFLFQRYLL